VPLPVSAEAGGVGWASVGTMSMRSTRIVVVTNPQGLHARPADLFVKTATRFASKIELVKGRERVDGKSILSLLTLAAVEGTQLSIEADGPDAEQALDALAKLVEQNFAENEHVHE
jgi:phosphotransferase system HPr (HPr) family protein